MSISSQNLDIHDHIELKDGNRVTFFEEPVEVDPSGFPLLVVAVSPEDTEFLVNGHYHPRTDEYIRILGGQLHVTLDGFKSILTPADGLVKITRGTVHTFHSPVGEYAEFGQREDPEPVRKRDYLRKTFAITETPGTSLVHILTHFYADGDAFPAFGSTFLSKMVVWVIGGFIGTFLGFGV